MLRKITYLKIFSVSLYTIHQGQLTF